MQKLYKEYNQIANADNLGEEAANEWLKFILALEKAAGLEDRDEMKIYAITSKNEDLIGERLFAFAGFLKESFRQYDYIVGRHKAIEFLQQLQKRHEQGRVKGELYLTNFSTDKKLPDLAPGLQELAKSTELSIALKEVDSGTRKEIKKLLLQRLEQSIDSLNEAITPEEQKNKKNQLIFRFMKRVLKLALSSWLEQKLIRINKS